MTIWHATFDRLGRHPAVAFTITTDDGDDDPDHLAAAVAIRAGGYLTSRDIGVLVSNDTDIDGTFEVRVYAGIRTVGTGTIIRDPLTATQEGTR